MYALLACLEEDLIEDLIEDVPMDTIIMEAATAFGVSDELQCVIKLAHQVQFIEKEKWHPTIPAGAGLAKFKHEDLEDGSTVYYLEQDHDELRYLRAELQKCKSVIRSTVYDSREWKVSLEQQQQWEDHLDEGWIEIGRGGDETDELDDTDDEWEFLSDEEEDEHLHPIDVVRSALEARRSVVPRTLPCRHPWMKSQNSRLRIFC